MDISISSVEGAHQPVVVHAGSAPSGRVDGGGGGGAGGRRSRRAPTAIWEPTLHRARAGVCVCVRVGSCSPAEPNLHPPPSISLLRRVYRPVISPGLLLAGNWETPCCWRQHRGGPFNLCVWANDGLPLGYHYAAADAGCF